MEGLIKTKRLNLREWLSEKTYIGLSIRERGMQRYEQIINILENLQLVLEQNIEGSVVELGCNKGYTSVWIKKLLNHYQSDKKFHVYDSFEGLPELHEYDISTKKNRFHFAKGHLSTDAQSLVVKRFQNNNLVAPIVHQGFFCDIKDDEFPEKICFAFYDGDLYESILDSFNKTFNKVVANGRIVIDDVHWDVLPGVTRACGEFLIDKKESMTVKHNQGVIIKQ